jgi:hypothetical protein
VINDLRQQGKIHHALAEIRVKKTQAFKPLKQAPAPRDDQKIRNKRK